jgi:hypothetical protein
MGSVKRTVKKGTAALQKKPKNLYFIKLKLVKYCGLERRELK